MRHERTHTEAFICILCGKPTWSSTDLVEHCLAEHREKSKHVCRDCGFYNFTEAMLKQHTLQVHLKGTKEYQCEQCNFKTFIQSTFSAHVRNHKKQRFVCEDCGKECSTQQALASHRRCHEVIIIIITHIINNRSCKRCQPTLFPAPTATNSLLTFLFSTSTSASTPTKNPSSVSTVVNVLDLRAH